MDMERNGFTLIELVIVIAVVSILALAALPSYQSSVRKSYRSDAMTALMDLAVREERFFVNNKTYTATLSDVSASATTPGGHYAITVAALSGKTITDSFVLTATAVSSDDQFNDILCRSWTLDSTGRKGAKDADANSTTDVCWVE